ncbi:MAG: DUF359 domain-containing protein [Promethearchaeota archaeon]|nr:MAG: DUF359 domain-containing protein [Candidatus Lokiarchaeota archaeon]
MDHNLGIPHKKRHEFSQPLGKLISGKREDTILEIESYFKELFKTNTNINFYLVGDIVTQDFLANNFLKSFIKLCIIDEKTQRNHINIDYRDFFEEVIEFQSPAGSIPKESWNLLKKIILSNKRTILKITEGEEDLLVLPLVLEIPLQKNIKNYVFYGQPPITDSKHNIPEGIVMVNITKGIQTGVKKYIALMEKI